MRYTLRCLLLSFCLIGLFQKDAQANSIEVETSNNEYQVISSLFLFGYEYGEFFILDSLSSKGNDLHRLQTDGFRGYAVLSASKFDFKNSIYFIIEPKETNFKISIDANTFFQGNFSFTGSISNGTNNQLNFIKSKYRKDFSQIKKLKKQLNASDPQLKQKLIRIDSLSNSVYSEINTKIDSLNKLIASDYLFLKNVVIPFAKMPVQKNVSGSESRKSFLSKHFFDFIDFEKEEVFHSPGTINAFEFYLSNAIPYTEKGYFTAVDYFLETSKNLDSIKRQFFVNYLVNYFSIRNYNYVVDYIYSKTDDCTIKLEEDRPQINLEDIKLFNSDKIEVNISERINNSEINIFYFWIEWCSACSRKFESTRKTLNSLSNLKRVQIFSVEADQTSYPKSIFHNEEILELGELAELKKSKILPHFKITTTPTFVVVDKTGKVIFKTSNSETLKKSIFDHLEMN